MGEASPHLRRKTHLLLCRQLAATLSDAFPALGEPGLALKFGLQSSRKKRPPGAEAGQRLQLGADYVVLLRQRKVCRSLGGVGGENENSILGQRPQVSKP